MGDDRLRRWRICCAARASAPLVASSRLTAARPYGEVVEDLVHPEKFPRARRGRPRALLPALDQ